MVEDHTGINNERIGEDAFLDQCDLAWREREAMMLHELAAVRRRASSTASSTRPTGFSICSGGSASPITRPTAAGRPRPRFARVIEDQYRRGDEVVGKAARSSPTGETLVIVLSDHGFGSFQRGVNLNTFLFDAGLLALRDGEDPATTAGTFCSTSTGPEPAPTLWVWVEST